MQLHHHTFRDRTLALVVCTSLLATAHAAAASEDATCRRIRAQAASEAALLLAPKLSLQAIRVPTRGDIEPAGPLEAAPGFQLRAGLSYSLSNARAGMLTLDMADADCRRQLARQELAQAVQGGEPGELAAARRALEFLERGRALVDRIEEQAELRHARHIVSTLQFDEIRSLVTQYERRRLEFLEQVGRLELQGAKESQAPIPALVASYTAASRNYDEHASDLRRIRRWDLSFRGGVVPADEVDFFGAIELTYNLGDLFQLSAEREFLTSRGAEIASSRSELPWHAARLEQRLAERNALLAREIELREGELGRLKHHIELLQQADAADKTQYLATAEIRKLLAEAGLVYARELLAASSAEESEK